MLGLRWLHTRQVRTVWGGPAPCYPTSPGPWSSHDPAPPSSPLGKVLPTAKVSWPLGIALLDMCSCCPRPPLPLPQEPLLAWQAQPPLPHVALSAGVCAVSTWQG